MEREAYEEGLESLSGSRRDKDLGFHCRIHFPLCCKDKDWAKGGVGCLSLQDSPRIMVSSHSTEADIVPGFQYKIFLNRALGKELPTYHHWDGSSRG